MSVITVSLASGDVLAISQETENRYMDETVDLKRLTDDIDWNFVIPKFRIFVLYPDETVNYEIPPEDIKVGGSYQENYQNGQRRTLSFTLYNMDGKYTPGINQMWVGTRLRFDLGVQMIGGATYWFRKGTFIITSVSPSFNPASREVSVSAGDKFSLFERNTGKLTSTYEIPYGSDIQSVFHDVLYQNIGDGYVLDPQEVLYNQAFAGKKTQVKITHNSGENFSNILLDLASQLSAEIFYNSNGNLVVAPINEITNDVDKPLLWKYNIDAGGFGKLDFSINYEQVVNRVIVVGTSTAGGAFVSEAVNDDPGSPLCWQRIGKRTGDILNDSAIYSKPLAEERAQYELRKNLILTTSSSTTVLLNPFLQVNNLISLSSEKLGFNTERFLLQSVSCNLDFSNSMSISFSNLRNLPFLVK